jgi:hypothetical protein
LSTEIITKISGHVNYALIRDGVTIDSGETNNMVVFSSRVLLAKIASGYGDLSDDYKFGAIKAMAIGIGNTAPTEQDTALENEIFRQNIAAANTDIAPETGNIVTATSTAVSLTIRVKMTPYTASSGFPTSALTGGRLITEFGLLGGFNSTLDDNPNPPGNPAVAAEKGTLFNRALIGPVPMNSNDTLLIENIITWG